MCCRFFSTTGVTCLLLVAGCQPPDAQFVASERSNSLMRGARAAIHDSLEESFGTPQALVAWQKLPVEFGTFTGKVVEAAEKGPVDRFTVEFDVPAAEVAARAGDNLKNSGLLWTSGTFSAVEEGFLVDSFDAETGTLTLGQRLDPPPAAGDEFVVSGYNLGRGRKLYMQHCMHCHGVTGDGNGPTAKYLNPLPRDYRQGVFKFTSTGTTSRARREDLKTTIKQGIPGTYMPSFLLLPEKEVDALVEYVRWLTMRGQLENMLAVELELDYAEASYRNADRDARKTIDEGLAQFLETRMEGLVDDSAGLVAEEWQQAEDESSLVFPKKPRIDPAGDPESIARGRKLYLSDRTKCVACHGATGRGDGTQTEDFQKKGDGQELYTERGLHDAWGKKLTPRDLTRGVYRGGRRPLDLYRRISAGIKGTPMPAFANELKDDNEIWDLVNYVLSIPYDGAAVRAPASVAAQPPGNTNAASNVASLPEGSE